MDLRSLLAFGTGVGIEIRSKDLGVIITHVRPNGIRVAATTTIQDFRDRPAGEWGSEYLRFLRENGASHLAATVVAPKREVIVRQIPLPGVARKDVAAAIGYQVETLHPYGEEEVALGWQKISENGTALIGIMRRASLDAYMEKFAEAGVSIACFTFSAAALHGALRLYTPPAAQGFVATADLENGEIEVYGESPSRPVFSAQFDLPADRAAALATAELRLPQDAPVASMDQILPKPVSAAGDFDFSRSTTPYAASLAGACPRLATAANLLPEDKRGTNSRMIFLPTVILVTLLLLVGGALYGYSRIEEKRYLATLEAESAKLQPTVKRIAALDKSLEQSRARVHLLDEFRGRSKYDLDTLNELTKLLAPPIWTNSTDVTHDAVVLAGEAEQAAPLLKLLDSSPFFRDSAMTMPIAKAGAVEFPNPHGKAAAMKIEKRERNLLLVAGVLATVVALRMGLFSSGPEVVEASADSVEMAEKKLALLRKLAATVPGKEDLLKKADAELATRESGVIQTETAAQAQAQLLQVIRDLGKANDIDARGGEFGPVKALGQDYGEVSVAVAFECGIEQLVNFLAALTSEKALLATSEMRITASKPKEKTLNVRLTLSGVVPRKLVPEQKGASLF